MKHWVTQGAVILLMVLGVSVTQANPINSYQFDTALQEQRFYDLAHVLRCPKCQNQSIADSNAPIAQDLRRELHKMVLSGSNDEDIVQFMLDRYGEFVLYKPRFEGKTLVLWLGPLVLLLMGIMVLVGVVRRHRARPQEVSGQAVSEASQEETLTPAQRETLNRILGDKQK